VSHHRIFVARDIETGLIVADRVTIASTRAERRRGLLGRSHLGPGEALLIAPCNGVHMFFMKFPIDILALDKNGVVVDAVSDLKPWRIRLPKPGSHSVLEMAAGTLVKTQTKVGHRIAIDLKTSMPATEVA
jgi:uncharacterized protein